jgi:hypothetical protein
MPNLIHRFTAILLSCTLGLAANALAKQNDKNKNKSNTTVVAAPKTQPVHVQKQKQKQINVGPNVNGNVRKQNKLQNSTSIQTKKLPAVQSQNLSVTKTNKKTVVVDKQKIEQIRAQHLNFKAKPNPKIASVKFNQNYQIAGAQNWNGPQYQAFVAYRPQWHDQGWWQSRYSSNILLIGGGWYYWDAGYWYPAWGYDESASYYPYDGPIYVGDTPRPFDQVVADCQATLQEQGYYRGEVDGLMGPLTREALASFQRDHGLITTAALDQPTLASLGLG